MFFRVFNLFKHCIKKKYIPKNRHIKATVSMTTMELNFENRFEKLPMIFIIGYFERIS